MASLYHGGWRGRVFLIKPEKIDAGEAVLGGELVVAEDENVVIGLKGGARDTEVGDVEIIAA